MSNPQPSYSGQERRRGLADRRDNTERRNEDRVASDMMPRRNPDTAGRRTTDAN